MGKGLLAVSLLPPGESAAALRGLQLRQPEAEITLLVPTRDALNGLSSADSGEIMEWRSRGLRALLAQLRARRFQRALLVHGPDQYATPAYWKAVALVLASGAREKAFREFGRPGETGVVGALFGGAAKAAAQFVMECCVAALGALLLFPLMIGTIVTDLTEALAGGRFGRTGKPGRQK